MDIKAIINDNSVIDIEMQVENEYNIEDRVTYYMAGMSSQEIKKGEEYIDLKKAIVIAILNFNYFERNGYMHVAHMKFEKGSPETYVDMGYKKEQEIATKSLEMIYIELPKFIKKNPRAESLLDKWLWLLAGREDKIKMGKTSVKELDKAISIIDEMSADSKEWEMYESRRKAIINYNSSMEYARREGRKEGIAEGHKKGIAEGRKEGIAEGQKKGIAEGEKLGREKTAKELLKLKVELETIMKATGLTKEEIEKLKEESQQKTK